MAAPCHYHIIIMSSLSCHHHSVIFSPVGVAVEVEATHHPLEAVVVGQHEAHPDLVVPGILMGQKVPAAPVAALVIVIVNEHHRMSWVSHAPALQVEIVVSFDTGLLL